MSNDLPTVSTASLPIYTVSVRQLVEFVLRTGSLSTGGGTPRKLRAQQGSQAHRKLQRSRPVEFESEVIVTFDVVSADFILRVSGRIDGLWNREEGILLEEIKTVTPSWDHQPHPLHWAQLKIYGATICEQRQLAKIDLQLTYFELNSEQITVFRESLSAQQLRDFVAPVIAEYQAWITQQEHWRRVRNSSVDALTFPYGEFRAGQRNLSAAVFKTIANSGKLFAEAPTGIGKTMSVLFPTAKAMAATTIDRVFYLTAKTVTQSVAEKALVDLKSGGARLRSLTITAKEKICVRDGQPCDIVDCPFAEGYYDRLKPALREALQRETLTRGVIEEIARTHRLCPHEFSLDISEWVDVIICDYNHAFDPRASLKRHFSENSDAKILLVDEAHNLLERAREMFSATLNVSEVSDAISSFRDKFSRCATALRRWKKRLDELVAGKTLPMVSTEIPERFLNPLESFSDNAEEYFAQDPQPDELLLQTYYNVSGFLQIAEYFGANYRFILDDDFGGLRVRLFCLDPSPQLGELFGRSNAAAFFSATLTPLNYFRSALGGSKEDRTLKLNSPFPTENLRVLVAPYIQTSYRHRTASVDQVAASIATFVQAKQGNYLVFFPSYKYLNDVAPLLQQQAGDTEFVVQRPDMKDADRADFLKTFDTTRSKSLVGLAVMGGVFGEGVDLVGDRLIGAVIVGVGLPQVCLERDLIRQHFEGQGMDGFAYAYVFPGFNRVLQAVGRVIRSESDKGAVLLIDSRFTEERFTELFPPWWRVGYCENVDELNSEVRRFWHS